MPMKEQGAQNHRLNTLWALLGASRPRLFVQRSQNRRHRHTEGEGIERGKSGSEAREMVKKYVLTC